MSKILNLNNYTKLINEINELKTKYSIIYSYNYTKVNVEYPYYTYLYNKKFFYIQKQLDKKTIELEKLKSFLDVVNVQRLNNNFDIKKIEKNVEDMFNVKFENKFEKVEIYEYILNLCKTKNLKDIISTFIENFSIIVTGLHPEINNVDDFEFSIFLKAIKDYRSILRGEIHKYKPYFIDNKFYLMTIEELLDCKKYLIKSIENLESDNKIIFDNAPREVLEILNDDSITQELFEDYNEKIDSLDKKIRLYKKRKVDLIYEIFKKYSDEEKNNEKLFLLETYIAGVKYSKDYELLENKVNLGDFVYLIREFDNEYDKRAIKIITKEMLEIGYIPRNRNKILSNLLDQNQKLITSISFLSKDSDCLKYYIRVYLIK